MPGKEVRGLFQALTEGGWGGLIGPTGIYILHNLDIHTYLLANSFLQLNNIHGVKTNLRHFNKN